MYAAMPAALKEAVERAYISAGWDLDLSVCMIEERIYPCFKDVLRELRNVIRESDYSQEVKDNYTGSLITRVKSLTNGLNGRIFVSNEIESRKLFDENTIVDLSRVGSSETKSMIMGILTIRLQEYRMAQGGMNESLKHVTVLEEAHNLLKRTSTEQSDESSNLTGKSVEMLSNAIAEMRTYGEGFVIVDQAPGLMDLAAVRNTNTKIILRLPDASDRELVGKSVGLNDAQIEELTKLPTGVTVAYLNDWIEPVLCKVDYFSSEDKEYVFVKKEENNYSEPQLKEEIVQYLLADISKEEPRQDIELLKTKLMDSSLDCLSKRRLLSVLKEGKAKSLDAVYDIVSDCFHTDEIFQKAIHAENIEEWNTILQRGLQQEVSFMSNACQMNVLACMIRRKSEEREVDERNYQTWVEYMGRKLV